MMASRTLYCLLPALFSSASAVLANNCCTCASFAYTAITMRTVVNHYPRDILLIQAFLERKRKSESEKHIAVLHSSH